MDLDRRLEELFRELEFRVDRDEDRELSEERLDSFESDLLEDDLFAEELFELSLPDCGLFGLIATLGLG